MSDNCSKCGQSTNKEDLSVVSEAVVEACSVLADEFSRGIDNGYLRKGVDFIFHHEKIGNVFIEVKKLI